MTGPDDYQGEMAAVPQIDDAMVERLLAGDRVPAELESVSTVVRALREVSRQPVPLTGELAERIAAGSFTPPAADRPADRFRMRAAAAAVRRVLGRTAAVGAGRLALAGLATGLVGFGGVGATGSLPPPVQTGFDDVVESVTGHRFGEHPGGRSPVDDGGTGPGVGPTGDGTGGSDDPGSRSGGPDPGSPGPGVGRDGPAPAGPTGVPDDPPGGAGTAPPGPPEGVDPGPPEGVGPGPPEGVGPGRPGEAGPGPPGG